MSASQNGLAGPSERTPGVSASQNGIASPSEGTPVCERFAKWNSKSLRRKTDNERYAK
ncbi:hypothetical protein MKX78_16795 [Cytobacillus sp. FSL R5-0569]|uniref:hypothetical protein n=1 Tax=Cytobacillus sp. FSL R5-0569 TaxID=2921649 RepID=UPI0030FCA6C7